MSLIQRNQEVGAFVGRVGCLAVCSLLVVGSSGLRAAPAGAETEFLDQRLPREISPAGLGELRDAGLVPFVLVDVDSSQRQGVAESQQVRHIYYSRFPGVRASSESVLRDRRSAAGNDDPRYFSQRLIGTPIEWQEHGVDVLLGVSLRTPVSLDPARLVEAVEDKVDMQVIDLRGEGTSNADFPIPGIRRLLPQEVDDAKHAGLAKQRWVILLDDGNGAAQEIAQRLYIDGYRLIAVLEGGYPALNRSVSR